MREGSESMAKRKTMEPSWSDVKPALVEPDQKALLSLVGDLYRLSNENKTFLHTRFKVGGDPLSPYRKTIEECMYPDMYSNKPIQISKAKKAISSYSKALGNPVGEAELMPFFVECGNSLTVNYGDMDEGFYDALNSMYRRAIKKVLTLPEELRDEFKDRFEAIMNSSSDIGWGYHDMLSEDYYEAFPEDEEE
jgi:hypothetical protein